MSTVSIRKTKNNPGLLLLSFSLKYNIIYKLSLYFTLQRQLWRVNCCNWIFKLLNMLWRYNLPVLKICLYIFDTSVGGFLDFSCLGGGVNILTKLSLSPAERGGGGGREEMKLLFRLRFPDQLTINYIQLITNCI